MEAIQAFLFPGPWRNIRGGSTPPRRKAAERTEKFLDRTFCIQYTNMSAMLRK